MKKFGFLSFYIAALLLAGGAGDAAAQNAYYNSSGGSTGNPYFNGGGGSGALNLSAITQGRSAINNDGRQRSPSSRTAARQYSLALSPEQIRANRQRLEREQDAQLREAENRRRREDMARNNQQTQERMSALGARGVQPVTSFSRKARVIKREDEDMLTLPRRVFNRN